MAAKRKTTKTPSGEKRYLIERSKDKPDLQVTIPASWKVTYGRLHPGEKSSFSEGNVLRFYEANDKQRAVFTNVVAFRDLSLPVLVKVTRKSGKASWQTDGKGNSKESTESKAEESWEENDF